MDVTIEQDGKLSTEFLQNDTVKSIAQNVLMILNTRRGTIPMYRDFGLPMNFIDKPIDVAETIATLEISEALEQFEPRAKLKDLTFKKSADGRMAVTVEVSLNE